MTEKQIYQYEKYVVDDLDNLKDTKINMVLL